VLHRLIVPLMLVPALVTAQGTAQGTAPPPKPEIFVRSPANGATVGTTFPVVFGLRNYGVAPAGVTFARAGHFHVLIDTDAGAAGTVIPNDSTHRHFGLGQIETTLTLAPGTHTLRLVLGDAEHKVIGPDLVSAPVTVTVKKSP